VRRVERRREHGFALVYLALVLIVLMIFAALAVDIGIAKEAKASLQAAVDSAALSGAQVIDTTKATQAQAVFDAAATEAFKSMNLISGGSTASMTGSCGTYCDDYQLTQGGIAYDVQVTTPAAPPQGGSADPTLLNVKSCYGVPTTFGGVVGWKSIPICSSATAQNGVGTGGNTNGGCGTKTDEFSNVTNTFNAAVGQQTISATYSATYPVDTNNVHFVVQTQYGNFIQIPQGSGTDGVSYSMTDNSNGSLTNVTFSYTLPSTIDTSPAFHYSGAGTIGTNGIYSNTFTANLQVIDQLGRQCGDASWTTCNPPKSKGAEAHDPVLDGGASADGISGGYGLGNPVGANNKEVFDDTSGETEPSPVGDGSTITGDGHDVTSDEYVQTRDPQVAGQAITSDSDDTITPPLGDVVSAGWPVGAIYNDEQPLDAAWTYFIVDGQQKGYSSSFSSDLYTFTDPSTVYKYAPAGSTAPSPITSVPNFGSVSAAVSTYTQSGKTLTFKILDQMGNPLPGENITVSGGSGVTAPASTLTALDGSTGTYTFATTPNGTVNYTVSYSLATNAPQWGGPLYPGGSVANESGSFTLTIKWTNGSMAVTGGMGTGSASTWPNAQHDHPTSGSQPGGSLGVMYDSAVLQNGWHSAVLFVNDGDRTTSGGDCGLATWAFSSTGGLPGPGTLHLIS
jgi:Flp pilus assembly protein TadG